MQHAHDTGLIVMPKGDEHWTRMRCVNQFVGLQRLSRKGSTPK